MITGALLDCGADRQAVMRAMRAVVDEPAVTTGHPGRDPCTQSGDESDAGSPDL